MTEKNIVIGPQLKQVKLLRNNILVRVIKVPYENELLEIVSTSKKSEQEIMKISKFHGFHPNIVEIVAVSERAKEDGLTVGDIASISESTARDLATGYYEPVFIDEEQFVRLTSDSISAVMNYYREYVKKGEIIKFIR